MELVGKVVGLAAAALIGLFFIVFMAEVFGVIAHLIVNGFITGWDWSWIKN